MNRSILLLLLNIILLSAHAADFASSSVLSQGRWVKVKVPATGVYRLSAQQLADMGFTDPSRVSIAGYGSVERAHTLNTAPDDLPLIPLLRTPSAIYFFAEGSSQLLPSYTYATDRFNVVTEHRNLYSSGSYYFITDAPHVESPDYAYLTFADLGAPAAATAESHLSLALARREERKLNGAGIFAFSRPILPGQSLTVPFSHPGALGWARMSYLYAMTHTQNTSQRPSVSFPGAAQVAAFSPTAYKRSNYENWVYRISDGEAATLTLNPAADSVALRIENLPGTFDMMALENASLIYERDNLMRGSALLMHLPPISAPSAIAIPDATAATVALDITSPSAIRRLESEQLPTGGYRFPCVASSTFTRLCVFTPSASLPSPEVVGQVANSDLHAIEGVDLLIVTTSYTRAAAERLAAAHRAVQGLKVAVVAQTDVFNEFSSGAHHPNGLRALVRKLAADPTTPLRYLILFGAGDDDTRAALRPADPAAEHMVNYFVENFAEARLESKNYSTDQYFGFTTAEILPQLSRREMPLSISVGRLPAADSAEADVLADKCIRYLTHPEAAGNPSHMLFAAGIGENSAHYLNLEKMALHADGSHAAATIARGHHSLFPNENASLKLSPSMTRHIVNILNEPVSYFNYSGHAHFRGLANFNLSTETFRSIPFGSMPFVMIAACNTTFNERPTGSFGNRLILHPTGPIAVLGSGRSVYMGSNQLLNDYVTEYLISPTGGDCLGDVVRNAFNRTAAFGESQRANNFCYNFFGDPALPVRRANTEAVLTAVNGFTQLSTENIFKFQGLTPLTLSGEVRRDGAVDESFNGTITVTLFDALRTQNTYTHTAGDSLYTLKLDDIKLGEYRARVASGRWELTVTPPNPSVWGANRVNLWAWSDNGSSIACGGGRYFQILPNLNPTDDEEAPIVTITPANPAPDGLSEDAPTFDITVTDTGTGVSLSRSGFTPYPRITLDGHSLSTIHGTFRGAENGGATATVTLPAQHAGEHTLCIDAYDVAGNVGSATCTFTVGSVAPRPSLSVDSLIARESVEFSLTGDFNPTSARIIVRDITGATVASLSGISFPYTWQFRKPDSTLLPDGTYRAYAILSDGLHTSSSTQVEFTFVSRK